MWWLIAGIVVLLAAFVDLLWTTLGTHGGGPLSGPLTRIAWRAMRWVHERGPFHRLLSFAGSVLLFCLLLFWIFLVWLGWTLVFTGAPSAVLVEKTGAAVDVWSRIYFVAALMFTPGTSEYVPNGGTWKVVSSLAAGSGLVVVTLAITYILAVLNAAVGKRTVGSFIWDMGATPELIIDRAWTGKTFDDLDQYLIELVAALELLAENHLAYPILQYFHSENRRTATPLRIAALFDTLILLSEGTDLSVRPPKLGMFSACDAVRCLTEVLEEEFVKPADQAPPHPDLQILRSRRIPSRNEKEFHDAVDRFADIRRSLLGMIHDAGWEWTDVLRTEMNP